MKTWLILPSVLISACATVDAPEPVFDEYPIEELAPAVLPLDLPQLHEGTVLEVDGVQYFAFTTAGTAVLDQYVIAAEANQVIALESSVTVTALHGEVENLTMAGRATERRLARRVGELNEERTAHLQTTWFYRLLLVTLGLAAFALN